VYPYRNNSGDVINRDYINTKFTLVWQFTSNARRGNVKKVYKWKPMQRRPLGRPKKRWEDDIRNDMMKLKLKNWANCIQDHKNWKLYVKKTKHSKN
jgi:hypothetical protein